MIKDRLVQTTVFLDLSVSLILFIQGKKWSYMAGKGVKYAHQAFNNGLTCSGEWLALAHTASRGYIICVVYINIFLIRLKMLGSLKSSLMRLKNISLFIVFNDSSKIQFHILHLLL